MSLTSGARLGPYEVTALLGEGGMGQVYRATDTNLKRQVAIKVLPAAVAADDDRLARFQREAEVLAALNHPHIAQIYGLEKSADATALVMELIEGDDLAERIARGPIPLDEALPIARQIAEALEAAHEQGIVHRDLKPANVKVRADGTVKVLDFGLARIVDTSGAGRDSRTPSPTMTSPAMTQAGMILGTAAYMAPEQARGRVVDRRADIWAFGCVLFEMLSRDRAFEGDDVADVLSRVLQREPEWNALPANLPPRLVTLLRRCLEKDPRKRLPHIGLVRIELDDSLPGDGGNRVATTERRPRVAWGYAVAAVFAIGAAGAIGFQAAASRPVTEIQVVKSTIALPSTHQVPLPTDAFAISPDGRRLVFVNPDAAGRSVLWMRALGSLDPQPLTGTEGASGPFWSPDSRHLAFVSDEKLKRLDVSTGSVTAVTDDAAGSTGDWNRDGTILFASRSGARQIHRVSSDGGQSIAATQTIAGDDSTYYYPYFLPDGRHFLYLHARNVYVGVLDGDKRQLLLEGVGNAKYAAGHLLFLRETTLFAQPFDPDRLVVSGTPVPIAERIRLNTGSGAGAFSVSASGVLVYQTVDRTPSRLTWLDRNGRIVGVLGDPGLYGGLHLSGDGLWAAASMSGTSDDGSDIWIFDVGRGVRTRVTRDAADDTDPLLSPDGRRIVFSSRLGMTKSLVIETMGDAAAPVRLVEDPFNKYAQDWSRDGQQILYSRMGGASLFDLWTLQLGGDRTPAAFARSDANEVRGAFSPDRELVAFESAESGRPEVYIAPAAAVGARQPVSSSGGMNPHWRADGKELFFLNGATMMHATITAASSRVEISAAEPLFDLAPLFGRWGPVRSVANVYSVAPDGHRFLLAVPEYSAPDTLTLVTNWPAALQK